MPTTYNGFGVSVWEGFASVKWPDHPLDCDAAMCIMASFIPVIPLKKWHISVIEGDDFLGKTYDKIPLRFQSHLVAYLYLRALIFVAFIGFLPAIIYSFACLDNVTQKIALLSADFLLGATACTLCRRFSRREQAIRLILGPFFAGLGDPATWDLQFISNYKRQVIGSDNSNSEQNILTEEIFRAPLMAGSDNNLAGEKMTDAILRKPEAVLLVKRLRKEQKLWKYT
jgi:hypothetical protein